MSTDAALVHAAEHGDENAFAALTERHVDRIRLHCYRMLGSLHDADDAVQETLIKAWRHLGRFEQRSAFGTWLYQIATRTCLNMLRKRARVVVPVGATDRPRPPAADVPWLEPYPDVLLPAPSHEEPEARFDMKESTRLAFVAAIQLLPIRQRAVLLLRDVLGWTTAEVADALETTEAAVNSALQRARRRLAEQRTWDEATPAVEQAIDTWMQLWEACDVEGLARLLTADASLAMPPTPVCFRGPAEIRHFFATVPAEGQLDTIRLLKTRANGQPAVAAYMRSPAGGHVGYGLMVFELSGEHITAITGFQDARLLFQFRLPARLPAR